MSFQIVRQNITEMQVDAIVNAANTHLAMGGGVCGAIFRAAGAEKLQHACRPLAPIRTGEAVITPAFALPCTYIIHTAGPVYQSDDPDRSEKLLRAAYRSSLELAAQSHCESVAFPLISSGIFGYPKAEALRVACSEIRLFLQEQELQVYLAVFDKASFEVSHSLSDKVKSYLEEHYFPARPCAPREMPAAAPQMEKAAAAEPLCCFHSEVCLGSEKSAAFPSGLDEMVGNLDEPFSRTLMRLIDARGEKDSEVYKRANLDRKLFSKIRVGKGYMPSKRTVLALCVALKLNLDEAEDLLRRAGYALSPSQVGDVIVEFFLINGRYNIDEINQMLFKYDQALLGG